MSYRVMFTRKLTHKNFDSLNFLFQFVIMSSAHKGMLSETSLKAVRRGLSVSVSKDKGGVTDGLSAERCLFTADSF